MQMLLGQTLIVLPAFNEEQSIGSVIAEIEHSMPGVARLVVDDGSADRTSVVAAAAGADVLRIPFNLGVGGAMRAGFRFALQEGYRAVVQLDADGQHDPAAVPDLLRALEHADVVIGARFAGTGDYAAKGPRRWAIGVLSAILSKICGVRLTDATSGFKAMGPRAVALFAEHYPAEYLGDTVEALVIAARAGLTITQFLPRCDPARAAPHRIDRFVRRCTSRAHAWPSCSRSSVPLSQ